MKMWGIVTAAGSGSRFGGEKHEVALNGHPMWMWARDLLLAAGAQEVVVVGPAGIPGGRQRQDSVLAGLKQVPAEADLIAIHDAARPLASIKLMNALLLALEDEMFDGAVPGLQVVDTIKKQENGRVVGTLDRSGLVLVQTPQIFRASILRKAHDQYAGSATDDATMVEEVGGQVAVVAGEAAAMKITYREDLAWAQAWLDSRRHA